MSTSRRGRGRSLNRVGKPVTIEVKVDPARRKRFEKLLSVLRHAGREEARGFDAYWEAVGEIIDAELYVAGGYDSVDAFLKAEVKQPRRTALRLVRVARYASPDEELRYGTAILDAALSFIEAKTGGPVKGRLPVSFDKLRIPVKRDGKAHELPLDQATLKELRSATAELLRGSSKSRARLSPAEEAITKGLHKLKTLQAVSVRVSDGKVRITGAPIDSLHTLARALLAVKLPPEERPAPKRRKDAISPRRPPNAAEPEPLG